MNKKTFLSTSLVVLLAVGMPLAATEPAPQKISLYDKLVKFAEVTKEHPARTAAGVIASLLVGYGFYRLTRSMGGFFDSLAEKTKNLDMNFFMPKDEGNKPLESDTDFNKLNRDIPDEFQIIEAFYKNPAYFDNKKPYSGILLHGKPGCGKTELLRALAGQGVPVFAHSATEFKDKYFGGSEAKIRALYKNVTRYLDATKRKDGSSHPCAVIFLDEIDSLGKQRGTDGGDSHMSASVLNQLLTLLDGIAKNSNIITIFATNIANTLDKALIRPGRIDAKIKIKSPTLAEKHIIFATKMQGKGLKRSNSLDNLLKLNNNGSDDNNPLNKFSTAHCVTLPNLLKNKLVLKDIKKNNLNTDTKSDVVGTQLFKETVDAIDLK